MGIYVRRVQTVLTDGEYQDLARLAEEKQKPISVLIREAIAEVYFASAARERRQAALQRILGLRAPVSDWPEMEQQIEQGATEG